VEPLARELAPLAILAGHTPAGADMAPRLGFRLESATATGCIGVVNESGKLISRAPVLADRFARVFVHSPTCCGDDQAGVGRVQLEAVRNGDIIRRAPVQVTPRVRVIAREREAATGQSLEDARVIVAGGRGLEGAEGFRVLEELASVLGAAVGASRVPCDLGWCPHSWQIGLTGKTVTPELYFAVGISGAGHHMAGCGNAKTIVAINSDPDAAIFKQARFGVVGDYRKVVPALIAAVKDASTT
jgi:electron transfer flavoprotein alpha subunit